MKKIKSMALLLALVPFITSCEDPFNPEIENIKTYDRVTKNPYWFEGLLDYAYVLLPTYDYKFDEVATDDAVTNVSTNTYLQMATGGWTASNDPESFWTNGYKAIMNLNQFLKSVEDIPWDATDQNLQKAYAQRLKGEAYGLRGMYKYFLLRNHAGKGVGGALLGIPNFDVYDNEETMSYNFKDHQRETFEASVANILGDLNQAVALLPDVYADASSVDPKFSGTGINAAQYTMVCGSTSAQRVDARTVKAAIVRLQLLAASPSFGTSSWETAAKAAGDLLAANGGIGGLDPKGHIWFQRAQIDDASLTSGDKKDIAETIWRRSLHVDAGTDINTWEANNYPPSQYGKGQVNPTQAFVDAFPMLNGYPIGDPNSNYDPENPYANRDPRLALYVVTDGSKVRGNVIDILSGNSADATDKTNATRTGYYLRKLLDETVNMTTGKTTTTLHIIYHCRFTEMYLAYAEAANEAWGPDGKGSYGFSAKEVIAAIRKRAGIEQPDAYLDGITGKDDMRALIRNERRIELCFEGFRFWDLRRWNANLTEAAKGVRLNGGKYETFTVEERNFQSFMNYGPIPETEITKFGYEQNQGW